MSSALDMIDFMYYRIIELNMVKELFLFMVTLVLCYLGGFIKGIGTLEKTVKNYTGIITDLIYSNINEKDKIKMLKDWVEEEK